MAKKFKLTIEDIDFTDFIRSINELYSGESITNAHQNRALNTLTRFIQQEVRAFRIEKARKETTITPPSDINVSEDIS